MSADLGSGRPWLPLGHAQIVDWRFLDRDESAKGSTAWVGAIGGETMLVRTWCEETITHFEFLSLGAPDRSGRLTVRVARPESNRLQVRVDLQVGEHRASTETFAFSEHPRTGLQAAVARDTDVRRGDFDPSSCAGLSPAHAEIFEYAPESALQTDCGRWLAQLLTAALSSAPPSEVAAMPVTASSPTPRPAAPAPRVATPPRAPTPPPPRAATPPRAPTPPPAREPTPPAPSLPRLIAATNAGENWELVDDETYIGRSKLCSVVLKSQRVSRKHASITREADGWYINDLGAANGIWAGADKIERDAIQDGAEYIIGDVVLTFSFA